MGGRVRDPSKLGGAARNRQGRPHARGTDDEALQHRRAEIAPIRNELEAIGEELSKLCRNVRSLLLSELHKYGYNPNEPRVPAGNPDGGRWTREDWNGSSRESTNGSSPNDVSRPLQYTELNTGMLTDATASTDGDPILSDMPADDPKHPVLFVDSGGRPILDDRRNPLVRPADLPPEMYVRAGITSNIGAFIEAYKEIERSNPDDVDAKGGLAEMVELELIPFRQGGSLDAERVQGQYVAEYHDYANIALGLFMAAAGVDIDDALWISDAYAQLKSTFKGPKDEFYTHSLKADVQDMRIGYELYESGHISPSH